MLESVIATMGWVVSNFTIMRAITANGNDNFTSSPSGTFRTQDGKINIAANKQEQFEAVCDVLEFDLKIDPRLFCWNAVASQELAICLKESRNPSTVTGFKIQRRWRITGERGFDRAPQAPRCRKLPIAGCTDFTDVPRTGQLTSAFCVPVSR